MSRRRSTRKPPDSLKYIKLQLLVLLTGGSQQDYERMVADPRYEREYKRRLSISTKETRMQNG